MCELSSVKFDTMAVNTELAKEYFKKKSNTFQSITQFNDILMQRQKESDGYNTIVLSKFKDGDIPNYCIDRSHTILTDEKLNELREQLLKLAKVIEENAELFGQIEHLVRNKRVNEVKDFDIKLIVQNLSCISYIPTRFLMYESEYHNIDIKMNADTPLANIGFVAQLLVNHEKVQICPTKETAAVTCLFVELCHKVGLRSVEVLLITQDELTKTNLRFVDMATVPIITKGCVGVITERSDLDSAVDVLLGTTTGYPWKLSRIFVQESAYDRFTKAMSWKTGMSSESIDPQDEINRLCDHVYYFDGKTFLVNYAGAADSVSNNKIIVEAYRTTKELIAMVTKYGPLYLSLWSSDISEANEIAYKVPSSIVWINNYGVFDGPLKCSETIYKELLTIERKYNLKVEKGLLPKQVNWSKKTFDERRRILYVAAVNLKDNTHYTEDVNKLVTALRDLETEDFARVENNRICTGVSRPGNNVFLIGEEEKNAVFLAKLLTSGAAIILQDCSDGDHFADKLSPEIPVCSDVQRSGELVSAETPTFRTKVVWTNFGTIFAN